MGGCVGDDVEPPGLGPDETDGRCFDFVVGDCEHSSSHCSPLCLICATQVKE